MIFDQDDVAGEDLTQGKNNNTKETDEAKTSEEGLGSRLHSPRDP